MQAILTIKKLKEQFHIPLLLFLLIFTMDKVVLKLAGIVLIFILHPDFRFKKTLSRIPLFYLLIVVYEIFKFLLLNRDFGMPHTLILAVGCSFWILSFLAIHQLRSIVDESDTEKINRTLVLFFLINAAVSVLNLGMAMVESGTLNPYTSSDERFNTSTGDIIKGVFMGPSYINMMVNSLFIFYFLHKQKLGLAFLAFIVGTLTTSNFANLVMIPVLIVYAIICQKKVQRFAIAGFLGYFIIFYFFVTPSNLNYLKDSLFVNKKQQQELIAYQNEIKATETNPPQPQTQAPTTTTPVPVPQSRVEEKQVLPPPSPAAPIQYSAAKVDTMLADSTRHQAFAETVTPINLDNKYGKFVAFKQTSEYLQSGVKPFLFGAGIGNYSSFLALRTCGLELRQSRIFNYLPVHKAPEFEKDHYQIFKVVYTLPPAFHSIKHFPSSFINQLLGEYGVIGLVLFLGTYVWFFLKRFRKLTYGKYLLFLVGGFMAFDYLFEYLSVMVIFELLMLLNLKESQQTTTITNSQNG